MIQDVSLISASSLSLPKWKMFFVLLFRETFQESLSMPEWPAFFLVLKRNRTVIKQLLNQEKNIFTHFDKYLRRACMRWRPTPCLWGCKASIRPGISIFYFSIFLYWWWRIRIYFCTSTWETTVTYFTSQTSQDLPMLSMPLSVSH